MNFHKQNEVVITISHIVKIEKRVHYLQLEQFVEKGIKKVNERRFLTNLCHRKGMRQYMSCYLLWQTASCGDAWSPTPEDKTHNDVDGIFFGQRP